MGDFSNMDGGWVGREEDPHKWGEMYGERRIPLSDRNRRGLVTPELVLSAAYGLDVDIRQEGGLPGSPRRDSP